MHKEKTPQRISMTEMVSSNDNWKMYSLFHDYFLELLSYEKQKVSGSDVWQLNYI
ncbi:hypothetical protein [Kineothrix sedimenti]|uniref:Uncharacterized protein n=1 Tax=Kineothrix sedimenti TaxID=3123317 RepID=A0ABZ3EV69_9FIRM